MQNVCPDSILEFGGRSERVEGVSWKEGSVELTKSGPEVTCAGLGYVEMLNLAHERSGSGQSISWLKPAGRGKQGWPNGILDIGCGLNLGFEKRVWRLEN